MNIKITYNWLLEYLDTDADPYEIQKYLSLCGPAIERVDKVGDDYVFDIEITSNRIDNGSVFGIAQECTATLPQFGKNAKLKINPLEKYTFKSLTSSTNKLTADLKVLDQKLASRVTAIILSNVVIGKSPTFMSERLNMCDIKSINNVVDISNYLMLALGQPNHTFDYDKIVNHKLHIRESNKGEKVKTLDEKEITLPGGDIVIEDGTGKLTDLAGIMGGYDSMVTAETKNVLLLLETYDPKKIRKTSMTTGARTIAATYFEKGLDPERIEPTLVYGVQLLKEYAGAQGTSAVIDIYPSPIKPKKLSVSVKRIQSLIGVDISFKKMEEILGNLGFTTSSKGDLLDITVPSFRADDVDSWQDIAEEIARIYGYFNIEGTLQTTKALNVDQTLQRKFAVMSKAKYYLKHVGLHEVYNYSMVSKELIEESGQDIHNFLKLKNTISQNIEYLHRSLIPGLVENIRQNAGKQNELSFFEIAKTYQKNEGDLPIEKRQLAIATNTSFEKLKGVLEGLFQELNITNYSFEQSNISELFQKNNTARIKFGDLYNGHVGKIGYVDGLYAAELDFDRLVLESRAIPSYTPVSPYATIRLDLTLVSDPDHTYSTVQETALRASKLLQKVSLISMFQDKITLQFEFSSSAHNITEEDAKTELENIKKKLDI